VLLGTGRAALQVRAHPGHERLGVIPLELVLDVDVEVLEAFLASHLGTGRPQQAGDQVLGSAT
jgi:hypothetical protein